MNITKKLNIEYFSLQSLFWMVYCLVVGFSVTYLLAAGYTNTEIGYILASANIFAVILQPILAQIADQSKRINALTIFMSTLSIILICSIGLLFISVRSFVLSMIYVVINMLANASIAFITSIQFILDKEGKHIHFGVCRAGGSLFYALLSSLIGILIERVSIKSIPIALCIITVIILTLCQYLYKTTSQTPVVKDHTIDTSHTFSLFIRLYPKFMLVCLGMIFVYYAHAFMTNYTLLVVRNVGGNHREMGYLVAFMAMMELPGMFFFHHITKRFKLSTLLAFSIVMYSFKSIIVYFAPSLFWVYVGFAFQAVSFGLYIPASVQYASKLISSSDTVKAQMMFNFMQTIGMVFASLIGGILIDTYDIQFALLISAIVSVLGSCISISGIQTIIE